MKPAAHISELRTVAKLKGLRIVLAVRVMGERDVVTHLSLPSRASDFFDPRNRQPGNGCAWKRSNPSLRSKVNVTLYFAWPLSTTP